ncbi:hypothetical protein NXV13_10905 [Bacteroides ovatus]|nr:hypothetical protein [Bacteroides ovatus]
MEVFGEDTVKNPYASVQLPDEQTACAGTYQGIALLGTVRDGDDGCKAAGDRDSQGNHGRDYHFGLYRPFRCAALSGTAQGTVSVNAAKALMDIFPIRHKEENRLRIEGSDGNVIFNVIVPQNPVKDGEAET